MLMHLQGKWSSLTCIGAIVVSIYNDLNLRRASDLIAISTCSTASTTSSIHYHQQVGFDCIIRISSFQLGRRFNHLAAQMACQDLLE